MEDFDKVIKENIEMIFFPLVEKLLGIDISQSEELEDKIQRTIEREPDFLKKVIDKTGNEYILQLEFQTNDEPKMVYRMAEYKALLQRKYEIPVRQFVIYLGANRPKMFTALRKEEQITGFELKNIHDLPVDEVVDSEIPEEVVLSILADYPKANTAAVIHRIIRNLQKLATDEATLNRYIQQLVILSRLRKLDKETEKQVREMPITYDIKTDYLFNKGVRQGVGQTLAIINLLRNTSMSMEEIAKKTGMHIEYVRKIKSETME